MKNNFIYCSILAFSLFAGLTLPSQAPADPTGIDLVAPAQTWGADTRVVPFGDLFIAGQPDRAALQQARDAGVTTVISLRSESESDWDEAQAAASLGLEFQRVPVDGSAPALAHEPLERVSEIVRSHAGSKILVHCSSGNRASAWLATYLAEQQDMGAEEAVAIARKTGLTYPSLEEKVRAYLEH